MGVKNAILVEFLIFIYFLKICLFLAALGFFFFDACGPSPVAVCGGYSLATEHRLLIAVVSLVGKHGL